MLNENIVSLLIPCYNGEQFVERCLINVLEQEYAQYIELILVNDGSTDKTEEIIFQLLFYSGFFPLCTEQTPLVFPLQNPFS